MLGQVITCLYLIGEVWGETSLRKWQWKKFWKSNDTVRLPRRVPTHASRVFYSYFISFFQILPLSAPIPLSFLFFIIFLFWLYLFPLSQSRMLPCEELQFQVCVLYQNSAYPDDWHRGEEYWLPDRTFSNSQSTSIETSPHPSVIDLTSHRRLWATDNGTKHTIRFSKHTRTYSHTRPVTAKNQLWITLTMTI